MTYLLDTCVISELVAKRPNPSVVTWGGDMVGRLEKQGTPMPLLDSLIAAITIQNSLRLVTRNTDDFTATGIVMLNPWLE